MYKKLCFVKVQTEPCILAKVLECRQKSLKIWLQASFITQHTRVEPNVHPKRAQDKSDNGRKQGEEYRGHRIPMVKHPLPHNATCYREQDRSLKALHEERSPRV